MKSFMTIASRLAKQPIEELKLLDARESLERAEKELLVAHENVRIKRQELVTANFQYHRYLETKRKEPPK